MAMSIDLPGHCKRKREKASEQCVVIQSRAMASDIYNLFFRSNCCFCSCAAETTRRRDSGSSSTPLSSSGINYEVFINFRGIDTREDFTDLLYKTLKDAGIEVFKDDKNLHAGEEIKQGLKDAIKRSRISIAIFSKNYASSENCLMELVQMWECKELDGQTIIPIFYDVSPHDVKHQVGDFATFKKHKQSGKVDAITIDKWKEVLRLVGGLSGFDRKNINGGCVSNLLTEVRKRVMVELKHDDQLVTDKLVGIDLHLEELMTKLGVAYSHGQATGVCGEDVRVIGICGMPGIGKTTLAKVVFNKTYKLFDGYSFLEDINSKEVKVSQELLIGDLRGDKCASIRSSNEGIKIIGSRFSTMKVLIVLDDVRQAKQIEKLVGKLTWFGPRSRIIVTTNRRDVLRSFDDEAAVKEHKVEPMSYPNDYQLFCKYAFREDDNPHFVFDSEYNYLSMEIVDALGGHPLAIELWARYLRRNREDVKIWRDTLDLLKKSREDGVEEKVEAAFKASYDSLNHRAKKIFLDIACFLTRKDVRISSYMWEACGYYPAKELKLLCEMYLLEIGENHEIRMHDLLRKFGRKLVESKGLHERSRFWNRSDLLFILRDGKGTENVEGIGLTVEEDCTVSFTCEEFHKMLKLRYLGLDQAKIQGTAENLLPNLRWLEWQACPSTSELGNMHLKKLIILNLSWSPVIGDSQAWGQIMEKMEKLEVLNLRGCTGLPALLNFRAPKELKILILEDCTQLTQIGQFISDLKNLRSLNLRKCSHVKQLPRELGCMESLKELLIDGTDILSFCFLEGPSENVETLSACHCGELKDISAIGHRRNLRSLALDDSANIDWDPETFEFPRNLRTLSLRMCRTFSELPQSIGELAELEEIDVSDTGIKEMPPSVENLSNLKTLKMERTHLQNFPEEIMQLGKLEEIDFSGCRSLGGQVCRDISGLCSLRILRLSSSKVAGLPQSICCLSCLQTLDLLKCNQLQKLPELPSSLLHLCWGSKNMTVPDLSYLTSLKTLCLIDVEQPKEGLLNPRTPDIGWITKLQSLETLELSLPNVTNLPGNFSALTQLRSLTLSNMKELDLSQLPSTSNLWTMRLKHCKIQEPKFSSLKHLSELELEDCDLAEIDGLEDLKLLRVLKIYHCRSITSLDGLKDLLRLREVKGSFSAYPSLPKFSHPVKLDICVLDSSPSVA